jgi:hypothetical protein
MSGSRLLVIGRLGSNPLAAPFRANPRVRPIVRPGVSRPLSRDRQQCDETDPTSQKQTRFIDLSESVSDPWLSKDFGIDIDFQFGWGIIVLA